MNTEKDTLDSLRRTTVGYHTCRTRRSTRQRRKNHALTSWFPQTSPRAPDTTGSSVRPEQWLRSGTGTNVATFNTRYSAFPFRPPPSHKVRLTRNELKTVTFAFPHLKCLSPGVNLLRTGPTPLVGRAWGLGCTAVRSFLLSLRSPPPPLSAGLRPDRRNATGRNKH